MTFLAGSDVTNRFLDDSCLLVFNTCFADLACTGRKLGLHAFFQWSIGPNGGLSTSAARGRIIPDVTSLFDSATTFSSSVEYIFLVALSGMHHSNIIRIFSIAFNGGTSISVARGDLQTGNDISIRFTNPDFVKTIRIKRQSLPRFQTDFFRMHIMA